MMHVIDSTYLQKSWSENIYDNAYLVDGPLQGQYHQVLKSATTMEIVDEIEDYGFNYGTAKIIRPPMVQTYFRSVSNKIAFIYKESKPL